MQQFQNIKTLGNKIHKCLGVFNFFGKKMT